MEENEEVSLKTKLQNILNEKSTKIIPENIKSGVTALGVTGTYGSDATATNMDVLSPETFYNVNGKQVGAIIPTRQAGYMASHDINIPFDTSKKIAFCIEANIAFGYKTDVGYVACNIVNGVVDIDNGVLITTDTIIGNPKLCLDDNHLFLYYLVVSGKNAILKIFEIDTSTLAGTQKASYTFTKGEEWSYIDYGEIFIAQNDSKRIGVLIFEHYQYSGMASKYGLLIQYNTLYFSETSIVRRYYDRFWLIGISMSVQADVNAVYSYGGYGYWAPDNTLCMYGSRFHVCLNVASDGNATVRYSGTSALTKFPISDMYYVTSSGIYTYDNTLKESVSINTGRCMAIIPNRIFTKTDTAVYEYRYDGSLTINLIGTDTTYSNYYIEANGGNNVVYRTGTDIASYYADDRSGTIVSLTRGNITYQSGLDATATPSDVMENKIFYNANGKQTGSIVGLYRNTEIPKLDKAVGDINTKLQDISYNNSIAVGINQSDNTIEIYDITNDGIDYGNPTVFTTTDLSCTRIMRARFSLENLDDDTLLLWVLDGVNGNNRVLNRYDLSISNKTISNRQYLSGIGATNLRGDYIAVRPNYMYDVGYAYSSGNDGWNGTKRI